MIRLIIEPYTGANVVYFWRKPGGGIETTTVPELTIDSAILTDEGDYSVYVAVNGCFF